MPQQPTKLCCAIYYSKSWEINFAGWVGLVGLAENKATQPSLAGAWTELGNEEMITGVIIKLQLF